MLSPLPASQFAASISWASPRAKSRKAALSFLSLAALLAGGVSTRAQAVLDRFNPNANAPVWAMIVQPDGKIIIAGDFNFLFPNGEGAPVERHYMAKLNPDGTLDPTFNPSPNGSVRALAVQADGMILAAGGFTTIGTQQRRKIARIDPSTGFADSFNPDPNMEVWAIAVQPDGKIVVGGRFTFIGGQERGNIARLDPTTGLADSFDPNANSFVYQLVVQPDSRILAGGGYDYIGGQNRIALAQLDAITGLADSFNPNTSGGILSLALQADGKILAGGLFNSIGGQSRRNLARLDPTTGLADSFKPDAMDRVYALAVQPDGKVLVGGYFNGEGSIGGQTRNRIARLDPTTGLADPFDPNANNQINSIAAQADGKILAGGTFTTISGQPRNRFARLSNDTAALQNLSVTHTTITWTLGGSSPQFTRVTFESSADNMNYTLLGNGVAAGSNWTLTGLSLPTGQNRYIRARGYYRSGNFNGSESITESVRNAFIAGPAPTPTPTQPPSPTPTPTATATASPTATVTATPTAPPPTPTPSSTPTATATATAPPTATATPTASPTPTPSPTVAPTPTPSPSPATQAINLSTRMRVQTGDNVGIGGFIITGSAPKHLLIRAVGPSLVHFGVSDVLADPVLELHGPGVFATITNDNWRDTQEDEIAATGIPPTDNFESAIDVTLAPGAYTAIVRGNGNTPGVGLVEVYDLSQDVNSKLANLSTRALVGTGSDIVIAGFLLRDSSVSDRVIVRGIGPSLAPGIVPASAVLSDPTLELRDGNGTLLIANNDWQDNAVQAAEIAAAGLAPGNALESAITATLPPGLYTALLAGLNFGTGIGVVEVYDLGP
ncbi:MAG TPA: delta-60 repeat domain-containing protein [Chthoniobacterales bacterium]|nr:delta-60 repeat domain-containing protein [Chthoniobacterales bacterium]